jgi:hypothetical protein
VAAQPTGTAASPTSTTAGEQEDFSAYARIVVTPKDDLTITFTTQL